MDFKLPRGKYKEIKAYADKVFDLNSKTIEQAYSDLPDTDTPAQSDLSSRAMFREQIEMEYNMYRYDPTYDSYSDAQLMKRAAETTAHSEMFTPAYERLSNNFITGLKRNAPNIYKQLTRDPETGRFTTLDEAEVTYDAKATSDYGVLAAYRYNTTLILLKQSPAEYIIV